MCTQIWVCHGILIESDSDTSDSVIHMYLKGGQAQTSLHKNWLRGIEKLSLTLPYQEIEPRVFGFWYLCSSLKVTLTTDSN